MPKLLRSLLNFPKIASLKLVMQFQHLTEFLWNFAIKSPTELPFQWSYIKMGEKESNNCAMGASNVPIVSYGSIKL